MSDDQTADTNPMDSNEFDSLVDDIESDANKTTDAGNAERDSQSATDASAHDTNQAGAQTGSRSGHSAVRDDTPAVDVGDSEPGFPFETQESVYLTEESWNNYDDLKHTVETYLRNEFNIRNVQGRELDEVFFRLAVERLSKEEIGDLIVMLRGFDPDANLGN